MPDPPGETDSERVQRASTWLSSESPKERATALSILAAEAPDEAVEPLLSALTDSDRHPRTMAGVVLLGLDSPSAYGEQIVSRLGGDQRAAEWFVDVGLGAGSIHSFGLTQRLLPALDELAQDSKHRRQRRRAAVYAEQLRQLAAGRPLTA
jgi:HEAT repeat protein